MPREDRGRAISESARMSSAAEARFRVQAANSRPRSIKAIALDPAGEHVVRRLAASGQLPQATFLAAHLRDGAVALSTLNGTARDVDEEIEHADLVVLVAGHGGHADAATAIGQACSLQRVMTTCLVVGAHGSEQALSKTLAQIRPWSLMVVVSEGDDYVADLMTALRA